MRSKAPLALMEQLIMLVVFALAAVLCLKAFVWADTKSAESSHRDEAFVQAQSAAEVLKSCGGDFALAANLWGGESDNTEWTVHFDGNWQQTDSKSIYLLQVTSQESELEYLGTACVEVFENGRLLAALNTAWQEVPYER